MQGTNGFMNKLKTLVLTGAGYSGKSEILQHLQQDDPQRILAVPETIQLLSESILPFPLEPERKQTHLEAYVEMIVQIQDSLERFMIKCYSDTDKWLVCDRALLDTLAYFPDPALWEQKMGMNLEHTLNRYDLIIQLEIHTAYNQDPTHHRPYSLKDARQHEQILCDIYKKHPHYHYISSTSTIEEKVKQVHAYMNQFQHK